jgi:hypothetical protein
MPFEFKPRLRDMGFKINCDSDIQEYMITAYKKKEEEFRWERENYFK